MPSLFSSGPPARRAPEAPAEPNPPAVTISAGAPLGLLLLALLLGFGPASGSEPALGGGTVLAAGLLAAAATYAALTLAEVASAWRARRLGLRAERVVVGAWGPAIPDLEPPVTWAQARALGRFKPVAAGSAALVLLLLAGAAAGAGWTPLAAALVGAATLAGGLALLDLLPGPARSGGLLVQARVWRRRDRAAADLAVARAGVVTGWVLIGVGFAAVVLVGPAGLWVSLVGWLTLLHSRFERTRAALRSATSQVPARAAMTPGVPEVTGWHTVEAALRELGPLSAPVLPLRRFDGSLLAVVPAELAAVPPDDRDLRRAQDLARPAVLLAPDEPVERLLESRPGAAAAAAPVGLVVEDGRVLGVIGPLELARLLTGGSFGDPANPFSPQR